MSGFITGEARTHATLFPEKLDDYISEDNATRVIDIFIDGIDLSATGFKTLLLSQADLGIILKPC